MPDHCFWCPFSSCEYCTHQNGANPPAAEAVSYNTQRDTLALRWDDGGASNEAAPAGNRGLTSPTSKES